VTASEAMKKLVGCLICRSTTKLTKTNKLPNVVTTMHMASRMAIDTVATVVKGAGQHSGPQGTIVEVVVVLLLSASLHMEGPPALLEAAVKFSHRMDKLVGEAQVLIRSTVAELEAVEATGVDVVVDSMHSGLSRPSTVLHILANFL